MRIWLKQYRYALVGALVAALVQVGFAAFEFSPIYWFANRVGGSALPLLEYPGSPIAYGHLATETTDPFLSAGEPPKRPEYKAAALHFPDVRSCLVASEQKAATPDLRRIDWVRMRNREQASVCLFRIFSSLEAPERAVRWLAAQGLRAEGPKPGTFIRAPIVSVHGYNSPQRDRRVYVGSSPLTDWFTMLACYGSSLSASWDEDGRLRGADYSQNYV